MRVHHCTAHLLTQQLCMDVDMTVTGVPMVLKRPWTGDLACSELFLAPAYPSTKILLRVLLKCIYILQITNYS